MLISLRIFFKAVNFMDFYNNFFDILDNVVVQM